MAPKRKRVVKTTRKVVRETVQVAVIDNDTNGIDGQSQSLPDIEGDMEELHAQVEDTGIGTPEPLDLIGRTGTAPPSTVRRMSMRRTITIDDKMPDIERRVPVEEPAPKETLPVRTGGQQVKEKPEERDKEKAKGPEEDRGTEESSEDQTKGKGISPGLVEQEAEKVKARERPKAEKGDDVEKKTRKRRRKRTEEGNEEYRRYVFQVLKQVHPGMRISGQAMTILNGYINDMFERLAEEAAKLSKYTGRLTLSSREIQGAVRLVLPGELGRHAIAEGAKAVSNYMSYEVS